MSRLITLKQIYDEIISKVISSKEEWKAFLSFASGIYKYSFDNALLIYAQRPDATVVADMPTWNRKVGRYINKGAKSIAVFDTGKPVLKLDYLFDIKDTNGMPDTIPVIWRLNAETAVMLTDRLKEKNGFFGESLEEHITYMAEIAAEAAFEEYARDIKNEITGTWLESLPYDGVIACFRQMVSDSIKYFVGKRCGLELDNGSSFAVINHFNLKSLVFRLGNIVCSISKDIINEFRNTLAEAVKEQRIRSVELEGYDELVQIQAKNKDDNRRNHPPRDDIYPQITGENTQPQEPEPSGSFFMLKNTYKQTDLFDITKQTPFPAHELINYRYSPEDEIGIGGQRTKFRANIEAIKTLKVIEGENRLAATDEQKILVRYTGWGGLVQAFDSNNEAWKKEYDELKELLTPEEYESARASTPNAHYTSFTVIEAMLKTLERFGLKNGNILEPSI